MRARLRYDVIVIGAGPAGAAAAYYCARGGCRTLLIDRAEFPRAKTCGDGLMPRAVEAVRRMGAGGVRGHALHGARLLHRSGEASYYEDFRSPSWSTTGFAVPRATLDHALLVRARAAGAEFIVAKARRLIIGTSGRAEGVCVDAPTGPKTFYARTIVAATGSASSSIFGEKPSLRGHVWGVAARTYLRLRRPAGHDLQLHFPLFSKHAPVSGYAWIFPVGPELVNIGAGVVRTRKTSTVSPKRLLKEFIAERITHEERLAGAMRSEPISTAPLGLTPRTESRPGLLLAGDVAGLANAFTCEGIGAALDSGALAADAILTDRSDVNARYRDLLEERFAHKLDLEVLVDTAHEHPNFYLDRGGDLLLRPDRIVGKGVRTIIWDPATPRSWWSRLGVPTIRQSVYEMRTKLARAVRAIRPLLGVLVEEMMADPATSFGRYVAFGAACRPHPETKPTAAALDGLLVLEALRMIRALHWDLDKSTLRHRDWGTDAVGLVLADTLNAIVLKLLCRMDEAWARELALRSSRMMGSAALAANGQTRWNESPGSGTYGIAARLALGRRPADLVPPRIEQAATHLTAWEAGTDRRRDRTSAAGLSIPESLSERLADLFDVLAANARVAAPLRHPPMPGRRHVLSGGTSGSAAR